MTLLARVKSKSFLRSSYQGLSEYVVGSSGIQFFTRLDSGEQCPRRKNRHFSDKTNLEEVEI